MPRTLFYTPEQERVYARMRAENHPLRAMAIANAKHDEALVNGQVVGARYNSQGRWELLAYQLTGDAAYARAAFVQIRAATQGFDLSKMSDVWNAIREDGIEWIRMYQGILPVMSAEEAAAFLAFLYSVSAHTLAGTRFYDSDQTIGSYMQLALMDLVFGTDYLTRSVVNLDTSISSPVGGLDLLPGLSLRRVVYEIVAEMGKGGQHPESSDYNIGTVQLMLMGWFAIKTILGRDPFPEIAAWIPQQQRYLMHELTPDLKQSHQWGDVQNVRELAWFARLDLYSMLGGWGPVDSMNRAFRRFVADAVAANSIALSTGGLPLYARYFYALDPWAEMDENWTSTAGLAVYTEGTGHVIARTGHTAQDRSLMFWAQNWGHGQVDHMLPVMDLMLYRKGRWARNHPLAYGPDVLLHNMAVVARAGSSREAGGVTESAYLPEKLVYVAGVNAGAPPFWAFVMPTYLHENRPQVFWLIDGDEDVLIVSDRIHAQDPRKLVYPAGQTWEQVFLYPANADILNDMEALKVRAWHMPTQPTLLDDQTIHWDHDSIRYLAPAMRFSVKNEIDYIVGGNLNPLERAWAVHCMPVVERDFDILISAHIASESESTTRFGAVNSIAGEPMQGARVIRPGKQDVVCVFSGIAGPKLVSQDDGTGHNKHDHAGRMAILKEARTLQEGARFSFESPSTLYAADLDETLEWSANGQALTRQGDIWTASVPAGIVEIKAAGAVIVVTPPPIDSNPLPPQETPMDFDTLIADIIASVQKLATKLQQQQQTITELQAQVTALSTQPSSPSQAQLDKLAQTKQALDALTS
jgi:hypothetical protein